jgi:hypothetical protein
MIDWLSQKGPKDPKHYSWMHPAAVCLVHYTLTTAITVFCHDWMLEQYYDSLVCDGTTPHMKTRRKSAALWLIVYALIVMGRRLSIEKHVFLYQYCWLCNVTLWMGALAALTDRPIIAQAYSVTVGIDQLMWYVDLTGYVTTGKFPVGVAKYVIWPGNGDSRFTCTHHLWTIPVLLYSCGGQLHMLALPLSFILMTTNVCLSRSMIPSHTTTAYLNVNLSHELWKDITFDLLQINYDDPPVFVYLFRLLWRWQGFNTIVFGILYLICRLCSDKEAPIC